MKQQSNSMKISEQIESICRYDSRFDESLNPADKITARRYIELVKLRHEAYIQESRYILEKKACSIDPARLRHRLLDRIYRLILKLNFKFPFVIIKKVKSILR